MKSKVLVYHRKNKIAVKKYGAKRALKLFENIFDAYFFARTNFDEVFIHRKDGSVKHRFTRSAK